MGKPLPKLPTKQEVQLGFGVAVRRLREARQITQEQLAELSEVHVTYVSQIERGLKNLTLYNVHRVAIALGTKASELLKEAENN